MTCEKFVRRFYWSNPDLLEVVNECVSRIDLNARNNCTWANGELKGGEEKETNEQPYFSYRLPVLLPLFLYLSCVCD